MKNSTDGRQTKPWTVHDARVNLAALLNDPRKARRDYDLFTKTWGESFKELPSEASIHKSIKVPDVSQVHFSDYLSQTRDKFLRHRSQYISNNNADLRDNVRTTDQMFTGVGTNIKNKLESNHETNAQELRKIQATTRQALDNVPRMFLLPDFSLEEPSTFTSVLNFNSPFVGSSSWTSKTQSKYDGLHRSAHEVPSSKLLQEKLSHYLDLVEVAIVQQISSRSDGFFDAMASHDDLNHYLKRMSSSIHRLRMKIASTGAHISKKCLKVVSLRSERRCKVILLTKLQTMITIHQAQPTIQLLLSTSEYAGALDLIETTQEVLKQELAGLQCFRHLSSQLSEIESVIGHMMKEELSNCIQTDLNRPIKEGSSTINPHHLTAIALGLLRKKKLVFLEEFREEVKFAVKAVIKTTVMEAVNAADEDLTLDVDDSSSKQGYQSADGGELAADTREKAETLAERMRLLEFSIWINLLNNIFDNLSIFLRRVKSFLTVIVGIVSASALPSAEQLLPDVFHDQDSSPDSNTAQNNTEIPDSRVADGNSQLDGGLENKAMSIEESINTDDVWDDMDQYEVKLMESVSLNCGSTSRKRTRWVRKQSTSTNSSESKKVSNSEMSETTGPDYQRNIEADGVMPTEDLGTNVYYDILLTEEEHNDLQQSFCENLLWVAEFSHNRCVKVIMAENKNSSLEKLASQQFLSLAQVIEGYLAETHRIIFTCEDTQVDRNVQFFTDYCTAIYGSGARCGAALRGILLSQASRFISRFHEERKNKLSLILDNETWKQAEVPAELAKMLQDLSVAKSSAISNHFQTQSTSTTLSLDGVQFAVVGTVLLLLKMVSEYIKCTLDLPNSTPDLVTRVAELLTLFNSRTYQLILGAGALQLAGLKTISTKNLGLVSRCLQLVLHLLPSVRNRFQEQLMQYCPPSSTHSTQCNGLKHFDHVTKDYKEHIAEIDNKLVIIMDSVIEANLSKWQVKAPTPSKEFRMICRQISKLHEMIADLLPEEQVRLILHKINARFEKRLKLRLQQYGVCNDGGPQSGLVISDIAFYHGSLKNLKVFNDRDINMDSVWG